MGHIRVLPLPSDDSKSEVIDSWHISHQSLRFQFQEVLQQITAFDIYVVCIMHLEFYRCCLQSNRFLIKHFEKSYASLKRIAGYHTYFWI